MGTQAHTKSIASAKAYREDIQPFNSLVTYFWSLHWIITDCTVAHMAMQ